jgi:hypothetical protein
MENFNKEFKTINYKVKVKLGQLGDFATEWWTKEDYDKWEKYIEELKSSGEYGKEVEYDVTQVYHPILDRNTYYRNGNDKALQSFKFDILDFSKN